MADPDPREAWLRLAAMPVTARRRAALLERFGSAAELFAAPPDDPRAADLDDGLRGHLRAAAKLDLRRDLDRLDSLDIRLLSLGAPDYPRPLLDLPDPPVVLFVRGVLPGPTRPCVGLVGTRRVNAYGALVAETLAREFAALGVGIISGLAAGIDSAAHRGALRAGGYTAALLGTGVDRVFPTANSELAAQIADQGALISEFPLGDQPLNWHFPLRNRLISGLSRGIVVVQAPTRSGALITATMAGEQGRAVMAVPSPITDARHEGCHALIRDGARLVTDVDDVLAEIGLAREPEPSESRPRSRALPPAAPPADLSAAERAVVDALGLAPLGLDDLIDRVRLSTPEVQSALVTLEIAGLAQRLPGNRYVRAT